MSPGRKVLLVDDDSAFRAVLARTLCRKGFLVEEAAGANEALERAHAFGAEWILLDLRLGRENGLNLVEPLLSAVPAARIVVATGYASIPTAVDAMRRGAWNYLAKPFDIISLLNAFESDADTSATPLEPRPMAMQRMAWEHMQRVLADCDGNVSEAARRLGVDRRTLQRRLAKRAGAEHG